MGEQLRKAANFSRNDGDSPRRCKRTDAALARLNVWESDDGGPREDGVQLAFANVTFVEFDALESTKPTSLSASACYEQSNIGALRPYGPHRIEQNIYALVWLQSSKEQDRRLSRPLHRSGTHRCPMWNDHDPRCLTTGLQLLAKSIGVHDDAAGIPYPPTPDVTVYRRMSRSTEVRYWIMDREHDRV
jgi:hypothetical protein